MSKRDMSFRGFVVALLDRLKNTYETKNDGELAAIIRERESQKNGQESDFSTQTIRNIRAASYYPSWSRLDLMLGLLQPPHELGDCLRFPDEISDLEAFAIEYRDRHKPPEAKSGSP